MKLRRAVTACGRERVVLAGDAGTSGDRRRAEAGVGLGETDVCTNRYHEHLNGSNFGRMRPTRETSGRDPCTATLPPTFPLA